MRVRVCVRVCASERERAREHACVSVYGVHEQLLPPPFTPTPHQLLPYTNTNTHLERCLNDVVRVAACESPDVHRRAARVDERLEEVLHHLRVERADALRGDGQVPAEVRAPAEVEDHVRECLVERSGELPEAVDALAVAERLVAVACKGRVISWPAKSGTLLSLINNPIVCGSVVERRYDATFAILRDFAQEVRKCRCLRAHDATGAGAPMRATGVLLQHQKQEASAPSWA
jgi:hypothetical protein